MKSYLRQGRQVKAAAAININAAEIVKALEEGCLMNCRTDSSGRMLTRHGAMLPVCGYGLLHATLPGAGSMDVLDERVLQGFAKLTIL